MFQINDNHDHSLGRLSNPHSHHVIGKYRYHWFTDEEIVSESLSDSFYLI